MRIPFTRGPGTVGREDRLVRGCIALSFLLLAGFAIAMSGRSNVISIVFAVLGLFFAGTSALGRDPFYAHFGIDTQTDAELASAARGREAGASEPVPILDLRDSQSDLSTGQSGNSLLGS
jgi:hypothetical protein